MENNKNLWDIIKRKETFPAPTETKRHGAWYEFIVSIDDDNVAYITMPRESYDRLMKIQQKSNLQR